MIKVYKTTDRIPVKIGDVVVKVSPLTYSAKMEIASCLKKVNGVDVFDSTKAAYLSVKHSVKDVKGLVYADGSEFSLGFEDDGTLSESSIDEIMNLKEKDHIKLVSMMLIHNVPDKVINVDTGEEVEGIEILPVEGNVEVKK